MLYIYIYIYIYKGESKSNAFLFRTGYILTQERVS